MHPRQHPHRRWFATAFAVVLATAAGCSTGPTGPTGSSAPVGAARLPQDVGPAGVVTVGQLRDDLFAFADVALDEMRRLAATIAEDDPGPATRAYVEAVQADVAAVAVVLAIEPNPEAALQDLMASIAVKRMAIGEVRPDSVSDEVVADVVAALTRLEKEIWDIGTGVYTPAELGVLRSRVDTWWDDMSPRPPAGVVNVADVQTGVGGQISKGLFSPIVDATQQIEEARMLGERFLFLVERLPTITLWQTQAAAWEVATSPESRRAAASMAVLTEAVSMLATGVDELPMLLDDQRAAFLSAFDEREATMSTLLSETGDIVREAAPLIETGERVMGLGNEAAIRLTETLEATGRLLEALRDADAPGGAVSLDIGAYAEALDDIRASTEALNEALGRAEGLVEAPRALIDHAAWRFAQLMLLLFVLIVVYRMGMLRLARKE